MIRLTYSEFRDLVEQILHDSTNAVWSTAQLDDFISQGLIEIARYVPYEKRETISTTASSREIDISVIINLRGVEKAEYEVGKSPQRFRNVKVFGDILSLVIDSAPAAVGDCYLYCRKVHTFVAAPSSLAGAVNNGSHYAAGDTSIILDGLGTGTIAKNTIVEFASTNGQYLVTTDATITGNAATIVISPGLQEAVLDNTVVTFTCNTLDDQLETLLADWVAGKATINKAVDFINETNVGGLASPEKMRAWGELKLAETIRQLRALEEPRMRIEYSRA